MTRDIEEIKRGLAQARAALNLLERFIAEYEARIVNILPQEDVKLYTATDDEVIEGTGLGILKSLNQEIHETADRMASVQTA